MTSSRVPAEDPRVIADITERDAIVLVLTHLGLDPDAPPIARARDPTEDAA